MPPSTEHFSCHRQLKIGCATVSWTYVAPLSSEIVWCHCQLNLRCALSTEHSSCHCQLNSFDATVSWTYVVPFQLNILRATVIWTRVMPLSTELTSRPFNWTFVVPLSTEHRLSLCQLNIAVPLSTERRWCCWQSYIGCATLNWMVFNVWYHYRLNIGGVVVNWRFIVPLLTEHLLCHCQLKIACATVKLIFIVSPSTAHSLHNCRRPLNIDECVITRCWCRHCHLVLIWNRGNDNATRALSNKWILRMSKSSLVTSHRYSCDGSDGAPPLVPVLQPLPWCDHHWCLAAYSRSSWVVWILPV